MTFEKWWEDEARGVHKYASEYDLTQAAWQAATLAERERAAKVAEDCYSDSMTGGLLDRARRYIAAAIRKREGV